MSRHQYIDEDFVEALGEVVRANRHKQKWKLQDAVAKSKISWTAFSGIESGSRGTPNLTTLMMLARAFSMPLSQLISEVEERSIVGILPGLQL